MKVRIIKEKGLHYAQYYHISSLHRIFNRWKYFRYYDEGSFDIIGVIEGDSWIIQGFSTKFLAKKSIKNGK